MGLVKFHLGNLFRFSGRQPRQPFWTWVAIVMGFFMFSWTSAIGIFFAVGASLAPDSPPPFLMMPPVMIVLAAIIILLLAAAVSRRLHDTGRAAYWGVPPAILLFVGLTLIWRWWAIVMGNSDGDAMSDDFLATFGVIFANQIIYLGTLITLVVLCCGASQSGENSYGPDPERNVR